MRSSQEEIINKYKKWNKLLQDYNNNPIKVKEVQVLESIHHHMLKKDN
jgi:hypothetical protein